MRGEQMPKVGSINVYKTILALIMEGTYKAGDPIREDEIASRIGVSRTPVRETLARLREKGLVEPRAGRGLCVTTLSTPQIFELYDMRKELEGIVARFASQRITDIELRNLQMINERFAAVPEDQPETAAALNREFHARLYDAARNTYLYNAVNDMHETIALLPTTFRHPGRRSAAIEEHAQILRAIAERDGTAASEAAVRHIEMALRSRLGENPA
jgi:DNA-binding GntR family transcriptional regulator